MTQSIEDRKNTEVGNPAYRDNYGCTPQIGYVHEVSDNPNDTHLLGAGGLTKQHLQIKIVWDDKTISEVSEGIAEPWLTRAANMNIEPVSDTEQMYKDALAKQEADQEKHRRNTEFQKEVRAEFEALMEPKIPEWAKAVIIAERIEDKSDGMADYYGSTTTEYIILAFSKHTRDLFPEMRKAALNHKKTAFLAEAPKSAEHRQKYSMGGGYFLKDGNRHSDGWQVSKKTFYRDQKVKDLPTGEYAVKEQAAAAATVPSASVGNFTIEQHIHTKKGFEMFIVILADRISREDYLCLLQDAKSLGGWYSRKWGKTPAGFAFKDHEKAVEFAAGNEGDAPPPPKGAKPTKGNADKWRSLADGMQTTIDHKLAHRDTNTPRKQRMAGEARLDGEHLKRTQAALRAMADCEESNTLDLALAGIKSKKDIHDLTSSKIDRSNSGYYDHGICTGKPYHDTPQAAAVWALLTPKTQEEIDADELRRKIEDLQFKKIDGYFPTPQSVIDQMIDWADLPTTGKTRVLEPSAGSGNILDAVKAHNPEAEQFALEVNISLQWILKRKGYNVIAHDFMAEYLGGHYKYVLMNPPFERGQDAEHVRKAFSVLDEGGCVVSVMSPGPFFRQDKKSVAFREWFEANGGEKIELPDGSFKQSGTGVSTILVKIAKA